MDRAVVSIRAVTRRLRRPTSRKSCARLLLCAVLAGLLIQVAWPPLSLRPALFVGLVLVLRPLRSEPPSAWFAAGVCMFAAWWGVLLPALLPWGAMVRIAFFASAIAAGGIAFLVAARLRSPTGPLPAAVAVPVAWCLTVRLVEASGLGTLSLSAALVPGIPALATCARWIGGLGCDAALWALAVTVAHASARRMVLGTLLVAVAIGALATCQSQRETAVAGVDVIRLTGLQPRIGMRESAALELSWIERRRVERTLDGMTESALDQRPGALVVWPEGGNRRANAQNSSRTAHFAELVGPDGEVLVTGRSIDEEGRTYSSVTLFSGGRFVAESRKAAPVPFAEPGISAGHPSVLFTRQGDVGVQVCHDALTWRHAAALRDAGADFLVITSDDASFGITPLARWHEAISVLHAIEVGLPMAFVSNAGPSNAFDADGRRQPGGLAEHDRGLAHLDLPRQRRPVFPAESIVVGLALFAALASIASSTVGAEPARDVRDSASRTRMLWTTMLALPPGILLGALAGLLLPILTQPGMERRRILNDWSSRSRPPLVVDEIAPAFRQSAPDHCGAAALAFALTMLGDEVFEQDIAAILGPVDAGGYTLAQLSRAARRRGFHATGLAADAAALSRLPDSLLIAHLRSDHFVVVVERSADSVRVFDPASGRRFPMARADFDALYSGHVLRVVPTIAAPPQR